MFEKIQKDPFRLFFPFAILMALYACSLWVLFAFFEVGEFPINEHARAFVGGFLYFSIVGFLTTAIPRFTQTDYLTKRELTFSFVLIALVILTTFVKSDLLFWPSIFLGWPYLFIFGRKRFLKRQQNPPFTFLFVGMGLFLGMFGSLALSLAGLSYQWPLDLERLGKIFFFDGMVMSLILGVGGRLIPGILGFVEIVNLQRKVYERPEPFLKVIPKEILIAAFIFLVSLILEYNEAIQLSYLLRSLVITFIAFKYWRLHEGVKTGKWHGRMLKLSCVFILLASWLAIFMEDNLISIKHLYYIGGYSFMTLLIASRVILSHGKGELDLEFKKYPFLVLGVLLGVAALTRTVAIFMPDTYLHHLGYAALLFFIATILWGIYFIPRIFEASKE